MSEIGNWGPGPRRLDEERSHWGLWAIVSSPLILGFDMSDSATMDRIWPIITNREALAVNQAWAGRPGTLAKTYPAQGSGFQVSQLKCDGSPQTVGWRIHNGTLQAPNPSGLSEPQCLQLASDQTCPPPTLHDSAVQCGMNLGNCSQPAARLNLSLVVAGGLSSAAPARWSYASDTREIHWESGDPKAAPKCLAAQLINFDVTKGYYVRQNAVVRLADCPPADKPLNDTTFTFSEKGELRSGHGVCLGAAPLNGPQLWTKPLPDAKVAILVLNTVAQHQTLKLPLADIPQLDCRGPCEARDVWAQADVALSDEQHLEVQLDAHASTFYTLGPSKQVLSWV